MKPWVEMQPHCCRRIEKEAKTSSGRVREGFSEEVAVDGSFQIRKSLLGLGKRTGLPKWKKEHVQRQGRRKRVTALGAG